MYNPHQNATQNTINTMEITLQTRYTESSPMPQLEIDESSPYKNELEKLLLEIGNLGLIKGDFSHCSLEVVFVDSKTMREINRTHRGKLSTTDVLSFPLECDFMACDFAEGDFMESDFDFSPLDSTAPFERLLGSIVINTELAKAMSESYNHTLIDEISLLFIHGFLHILGFDHEVDNGEQRALEQCIIESIGLKQSLIVRAETDSSNDSKKTPFLRHCEAL